MTVKDLSQYYHLQREIADLRRRIEEIKAKGISLSAGIGKPIGRGKTNKIEWSIETAEKYEKQLTERLVRCEEELIRLEGFISSCPDSMLRAVMRYRFVDGLHWGQVAARMKGNNTADTVKKSLYRYLKKVR